jgi:hypothetical protein
MSALLCFSAKFISCVTSCLAFSRGKYVYYIRSLYLLGAVSSSMDSNFREVIARQSKNELSLFKLAVLV